MTSELTFAIYPALEVVSLDMFTKTVEDVHRLVRDVDYAATRERSGRHWLVAQLHSSVPTVTIRPAVDSMDVDTAQEIVAGLRQFMAPEGLTEPPPYFSADVLEDLMRLRTRFRGQTPLHRITFSSEGEQPVAVTKVIAENVERVRRGGDRMLGSVEGELDVVNLHGKPSFTIWDRVTRKPVRCWFPNTPEWKSHVKHLLEERVLVFGQVQYYRSGGPYSIDSIRDVRSMRVDPSWPRAAFGSIPRLTGNQDSVQYLRLTRE